MPWGALGRDGGCGGERPTAPWLTMSRRGQPHPPQACVPSCRPSVARDPDGVPRGACSGREKRLRNSHRFPETPGWDRHILQKTSDDNRTL